MRFPFKANLLFRPGKKEKIHFIYNKKVLTINFLTFSIPIYTNYCFMRPRVVYKDKVFIGSMYLYRNFLFSRHSCRKLLNRVDKLFIRLIFS